MADLRRTLAIRTIALGRRLFANTPVQRWPVTTWILRRVFRLGYGTEDLQVQFRGITVIAPADDVTLVPGVVGGFYEELELDIFTRIAEECSLVADVGGNIGIFACLAAVHMPHGRVVSFEPVPSNLAYLRRNLAANDVTNRVDVVEEAVSDAPGTAPIYIAESIGTHSLASANAESEQRIDVPVTTLDQWFADRGPDLLKIDVEGFDGYALRGGSKMLATHKPTLFVEYTPRALAAAGFDPEAMLRSIFELYEDVFLIDEPRHTVVRTSESELREFFGRSGNWNLIAIANQDHLKLLTNVLAAASTAHTS